MRLDERAAEIAAFLGVPVEEARTRLAQGFPALHAAVAEDFRRAGPRTDKDLLQWYRETTAYIYELSAYHLDPGFNYAGMIQGIAGHLVIHGYERVLTLGDGIGDATISFGQAGFEATYHDLAGSRTAAFAETRLVKYLGAARMMLTEDWTPRLGLPALPSRGTWTKSAQLRRYDAVVALDFMEHLPNVPDWAQAIYEVLRPGGQVIFQNAFAIGDDAHEGSIPMHLTKNNIYAVTWPDVMQSIGFIEEPGGWWRKP
jgi:SAM-dependent methyltransferase